MEKYDVNTYSNEELYEIVGYSDPETEDLEKIIIERLQRYMYASTPSDIQMFTFLKDIYNHFFYEDDDEEQLVNDEDDEFKDVQQKQVAEDIVVNDDEVYDVSKYTWNELHSLLDLAETATQRELEAKLIQMMQLYKDDNTPQGRKRFTFYKDVYNRFFWKEDEQEVDQQPEKINFTQQLEYTKGTINPILKETYKRIISIDSQYRDSEYQSATDFTLNITETLKDVVSLKLYAVQIPVTWYTISNNYGSNYFILKPIDDVSTRGIYNYPEHEYRVEIDPGNYTQTTLAAQIKRKLENLQQIYTDVSFGRTTFSYEPTNAKSTLTIDIQKVYNESYYDMVIEGSGIRDLLNIENVEIGTIYSLPFTRLANTEESFVVDTTNRTIKIEHYLENTILQTILITLDLNSDADIEDIATDLNGKLAKHECLSNSGISKIQGGNNTSKYEWVIHVNRKNTKNIVGSKVRIVFPDGSIDTNMSLTGRILWQDGFLMEESASIVMSDYTFTISSSPEIMSFIKNEKIIFRPKPNVTGGVYIPNRTDNDITLQIVDGSYNVANMIAHINQLIGENPLLQGSLFSTTTESSLLKVSLNINKVYTTKDYRIVFYDVFSFTNCSTASSSYRNATADTTLGYIMGFKELVEYKLTSDNVAPSGVFLTPDLLPTNNKYTFENTLNESGLLINTLITLAGDSVLNIYLYNYFMIILEDFNQNHLNDGLVTVSKRDTSVTLPSYANRKNYRGCQPSQPITPINRLTEKQIYSVEQIMATQNKSRDFLNAGPFIKDMFALLPIKASGVEPGTVYVEFGGTLQQQERVYFGPVNINRLMVKLVNDKGDVVDLNGANWSFQLVCEQLYQKGGSAI